MTARFSWNQRNTRGHIARLQWISDVLQQPRIRRRIASLTFIHRFVDGTYSRLDLQLSRVFYSSTMSISIFGSSISPGAWTAICLDNIIASHNGPPWFRLKY